MLRQTSLLIVAAALAGCSASAEMEPASDASQSQTANAQLAAYAASAELPQGEASDDLRAAAVVNRESNNLKIYNFSNRALRNVDVWVNGSFVGKVSNIPANGSAMVPRSAFYDSSGRSLAQENTMINSVQIVDDDKLYNLQGPAVE